ncbi:hypothetical protein ACQJBY_065523 [Aegilops geniculata]
MGGGGGGAEEVELTAQETALYDRQIRVWGVDAQKRLSKAHVLVCGVNGTTIEFCKNIVLAGVGSLSLMDDHIVTEDDLNSNFLIPHDESVYGGKSRAEVCCESLKDFNPMVRVAVAKGELYSLMHFFLSLLIMLNKYILYTAITSCILELFVPKLLAGACSICFVN